MGHRPGSCIRSGCQKPAHARKQANIFHGAFQNLLHRVLCKPSPAPQISNGRQRRHPDCPGLLHGVQGSCIQIRAVFNGIHAGSSCGFHRPGAVGMGHYRHPLFVCNVNQLPDFVRLHTILRQDAKPVKVHQSGNHNFDKIRTVVSVFLYELRIFPEILVFFSDKTAVVSGLAQGAEWCPVGNPIISGQFSGPLSHAPAVTAVPEPDKAQLLITGKYPANPDLVHSFPVPADGGLPVQTIQYHMDMTIQAHTPTLLRKKSA